MDRMRKVINLPLYGEISLEGEPLAWDLCQTEAAARLRDISLSSTPSRFAPQGAAASRFSHSVGVACLARSFAGSQPGLAGDRPLLEAAAMCHDAGSPPFSHISEIFMHDLTGAAHEQATAGLLAPGSELHELLAGHGVSGEEVVEVVTGRHPRLGELMAGSIDLDNLDNSASLLDSFGYPVPAPPRRVLEALRFSGGRLSLHTGGLRDVLAWEETRRRLYRVLSSEVHRSASAMLYRAVEDAYAAGALDASFFWMGESDALSMLAHRSTPDAGLLLRALGTWRHFPLAARYQPGEPDPRIWGLQADWKAKLALADRIAAECGLERWECAVYAGQDKGAKPIRLPWEGPRAREAAALFSGGHATQEVSVFCHKRASQARVQAALMDALAGLPEADEPGHVFF